MNWYYVEQGKQAGPVNDEQFDEMVRNGKITSDTLVWHEGMANWVPCHTVKGEATQPAGALPPIGASPEAVCTECGKIYPADETIRYGNARVCAACKPAFLQKLQEGAVIHTGELRYAGFWIRVGAKILDVLILAVPFAIVFSLIIFSIMHPGTQSQPVDPFAAMLVPLLQVGMLFVQMAYAVFFVGKYGATPGKMACGIKIVTGEGGKVSYGRATGRFFAEMLSGLICYIGYIMVAFDGQKRGLHDHICNTRVVYK